MRSMDWKKSKKIVPSAVYANTAALGSPVWEIGDVANCDFELVLSGSAGTPSLVVTVHAWDEAAGAYYNLALVSTALAADGRKGLSLGLNVPTSANNALQVLPPKKVKFVFSGTIGSGSATVSLNGRAQ